jgi:uncharacterized membrane protein (DUF441 family)
MVRRGNGLRQKVVGFFVLLLIVKCVIGKNNSVDFSVILIFKALNLKGCVINLKSGNSLSTCLKTEKN